MANSETMYSAVKAENVRLGVKAETWEDAIKATGMTLVENGYVKEGYIQDAINRELKWSTGLRVEPIGIAIPHGETQENIIDSAIGISVLEKPVKFVEAGTDPKDNITVDVQIVMMLAFKEAEGQLATLQALMGVVQSKETIEKLLNVKSAEEYIEVFCSSKK